MWVQQRADEHTAWVNTRQQVLNVILGSRNLQSARSKCTVTLKKKLYIPFYIRAIVHKRVYYMCFKLKGGEK